MSTAEQVVKYDSPKLILEDAINAVAFIPLWFELKGKIDGFEVLLPDMVFYLRDYLLDKWKSGKNPKYDVEEVVTAIEKSFPGKVQKFDHIVSEIRKIIGDNGISSSDFENKDKRKEVEEKNFSILSLIQELRTEVTHPIGDAK